MASNGIPFGDYCPACGSPDVEPENPHAFPGDIELHECQDPTCGHRFRARVPEPPDAYDGDGSFAANH